MFLNQKQEGLTMKVFDGAHQETSCDIPECGVMTSLYLFQLRLAAFRRPFWACVIVDQPADCLVSGQRHFYVVSPGADVYRLEDRKLLRYRTYKQI